MILKDLFQELFSKGKINNKDEFKEGAEKMKKSAVYMNRELSWLKFNERVLNEAGNPRVPLAERLSFVAIYQSNLDEFYRVRVGTLVDQLESTKPIKDNLSLLLKYMSTL